MKYKAIFVAIAMASIAFGQPTTHRKKGLIPPSEKELTHIKKNWQKIECIHPNKIGAARIHIEHAKRKLKAATIEIAHNDHHEFKTPLRRSINAPFILPTSVDNSKLPAFPPIGDQGQESSCLAWASTYYQASHELGLVNGKNNKNTFTHVYSPKWTYNMINSGEDNGSIITDAYALLAQNGAASLVRFPYDSNYLSWDLNSQDWISALSNRLSPPKFLPGLDGDISHIKSVLNNGHVLTFATFIDSWVFTKVGAESNHTSPHVGEWAVSWMHGTDGGHMMTIVGYDDNIWIDVNGNGTVDSGEYGAFLVANSWGSSWGNKGFIWVSYDAFRSTSQVPHGPTSGRVPLAAAGNSYAILATAKAPHYSPSLVAEFQLSQINRSQIKVVVGASDTTKCAPTKYFLGGALMNQGGPFDFSGMMSSMPLTSTFCMDLTDLIPTGSRYYFILRDDPTGSPSSLNALSLIDLAHGNTLPFIRVPQAIDNSKIMLEIDYSFPEIPTAIQPKRQPVGLSWPVANQTVSSVIPMVFSSNKTVTCVDFFIDSKWVGKETEAPYCVFVDTTQLTNGPHLFSATVQQEYFGPTRSRVVATVQN